jgi:YggT family protein
LQTALNYLHSFAQVFIYLYIAAIVLRTVAFWFAFNDRGPLMGFLFDVTEPVLAPLRRINPGRLGVDFAPIFAVLVLFVAGQFLG